MSSVNTLDPPTTYLGTFLAAGRLHHRWLDGMILPVLAGGAIGYETDALHPWPPHVIVGNEEAGPFLGLSDFQLKRARLDGVLVYYLHRGRSVGYLAADLYQYRDSMRRVKERKSVTRVRTPEHNAKIAASVRAARARS